MTTSSYMPSSDNGKADLLEHLATSLPSYAASFTISDEDLARLKADAVAFRYTLLTMGGMQACSQNWTNFKNHLRDGVGSGEWPVIPALPQPIASPVNCGIIPRLSALIAQIKVNTNYTEAIGKDLWIIGSKQIIDLTTWKPILNIKIQAGHPIIMWNKGNAAAIEIWVDRGEGNNFTQLAINTEPNTADNGPLPAPGTSAMWRYKAIYLLHDERVGQWSDVISVSVNG
jgi:hypothetical protein